MRVSKRNRRKYGGDLRVAPNGEEMSRSEAARDMADFRPAPLTPEQDAEIRGIFEEFYGPDIFVPPGYRRKAKEETDD